MRDGLIAGVLAAVLAMAGCSTSSGDPTSAPPPTTTIAKKSLADLWVTELNGIDTNPCVGSGGATAVAIPCEQVLTKVGSVAELVKKDAQIRTVPTVVTVADQVSTAAQSWTIGMCRDSTDAMKNLQCFNNMITVINGPAKLRDAVTESGR